MMFKLNNPPEALFRALERMEEALSVLDRHDQHLVAAQLSLAIDSLKALLP